MIVKIKSFRANSLSALFNAKQELMNTKPSEIEAKHQNEIDQGVPEKYRSKYDYCYADLQVLQDENENFPLHILGTAELSEQEISEFKQSNLVILGLRNKIY